MTPAHSQLTAEALLSAPRRSACVPNHDGKLGLYTVSEYTFGDKGTTKLRVINLETEASVQVTDDDSVHGARWIPGTSDIAYMKSGDKGKTELFYVSITEEGNAGESQLIATYDAPINTWKLKRLEDGNVAIVVAALVGPDGEMFNDQLETPKSTGRIFDSANVRSWNTLFKPERYSLWYGLIEGTEGSWEVAKEVTSDDEDGNSPPAKKTSDEEPEGNWPPRKTTGDEAPDGNWPPRGTTGAAHTEGNWPPRLAAEDATGEHPDGNWPPRKSITAEAPEGNWPPRKPASDEAPDGNWPPRGTTGDAHTEGNWPPRLAAEDAVGEAPEGNWPPRGTTGDAHTEGNWPPRLAAEDAVGEHPEGNWPPRGTTGDAHTEGNWPPRLAAEDAVGEHPDGNWPPRKMAGDEEPDGNWPPRGTTGDVHTEGNWPPRLAAEDATGEHPDGNWPPRGTTGDAHTEGNWPPRLAPEHEDGNRQPTKTTIAEAPEENRPPHEAAVAEHPDGNWPPRGAAEETIGESPEGNWPPRGAAKETIGEGPDGNWPPRQQTIAEGTEGNWPPRLAPEEITAEHPDGNWPPRKTTAGATEVVDKTATEEGPDGNWPPRKATISERTDGNWPPRLGPEDASVEHPDGNWPPREKGTDEHPDGNWPPRKKLLNLLRASNLEAPVGLQGPGSGEDSFDLSQNGVVFAARDLSATKPEHVHFHSLYYMPLGHYTFRPIGSPKRVSLPSNLGPGNIWNVRFTPDENISFLFSPADQTSGTRLYIADRKLLQAYDAISEVGSAYDDDSFNPIMSFEWAGSGDKIFFVSERRAREALWSLKLEQGAKPQILFDRGAVAAFHSLGDTFDKILLSSSSFTSSRTWEVINVSDAAVIKTIQPADDEHASLGLSPGMVTEIEFKGDEGSRIHTVVVKPTDFDETKKYPWLLMIHGGPVSAWSSAWGIPYNAAAFAQQGFVVVCPNITGSSGYGLGHARRIRGDWLGKPFRDIECFMNNLHEYPYLDPSKAIVAGGSYGGLMFCGAIWDSGIVNMATFTLYMDTYWYDGPFNEALYPWHDPKAFAKCNPATPELLAKWKNAPPTLVIHAEKDYRVPITEGLAAFKTLQAHGVRSRFLTFSDECHGISNPENVKVLWETMWDWMVRCAIGEPKRLD